MIQLLIATLALANWGLIRTVYLITRFMFMIL